MLALTGGLRAVSMAGNATRSIRLRSSASAYLNRTPSADSNRNTWTFSAWIKRGALGSIQSIFACQPFAGSWAYLMFTASNQLRYTSTATSANLITSATFSDCSAWYHVVLAHDNVQATASDRLKMYVNGNQITSFATAVYPSQNTFDFINTNTTHNIGRFPNGSEYFDGYFAEINLIDGQALTPLSFGQFDATTGVWSPKRYTGAYGANGFYLRFSDTASFGKDFSKLGNNWTANNISVTAGSTYDSMFDVPTNNYCVWNVLNSNLFSNTVDGNLRIQVPNVRSALASISMTSGKWYCEMSTTEIAAVFGISPSSNSYFQSGSDNAFTNGWGYVSTGNKRGLGVDSAYGSNWLANDIIGIAYDADIGSISFYRNGTSQGVAFTGISVPVVFAVYGSSGTTSAFNAYINCGQRPFQYTPPSGYLSLCTANLPTPTVVNGASVMAATAYTGTGSALTITNTRNGASFQPDFVWMKGRSGATDHALYDVVRGTTKDLVSNSFAAETTEATGLTAFAANGFTVGALAKLNTAAATYIAWQWKANGAAVSNTAGTITSQVSTNQTAGFSVITYTGTGTVATVGHGLGVAPSFIIIKNSTTGSTNWIVYSSKLTATNYLQLNTTSSLLTSSGIFNNTEPTLSLFNVGTSVATNNSLDKYVAYCFAEIAGFSKFGSYTGNGAADGPFVYCGFKPRFIMVKVSSTTGDWAMIDTTRSTFNVAGITSSANTATAEAALLSIDILSNGFKIRSATLNNTNAATYIFAAWAENSIKYALAN